MTQQAHHPTPAAYWKIAVVLGVLTAIEVALYYINLQLDLGLFNGLILILLAISKFVIVVGWYMHLKYEKRLVNSFFVAGFRLAVALYTIVLAALGALVIRGG